MKRRALFRRESASTSAGLDIGALAPMVDMMTVLLVLLLRTYTTDPAPAPPDGQFQLGTTLSESTRRESVEVIVSREAIYVSGRRVIATAYLPEELLVREIYDRLLAQPDRRRVEIYADAAVQYGALRRVLYTARAAGFEQIALMGSADASL